MTTFNFRGLPDCFVRMIRFFVLLNWHDICLISFCWIVQTEMNPAICFLFISASNTTPETFLNIYSRSNIFFKDSFQTFQYLWHNDHCYHCALFRRLPSFRSQDRDERLFMSLCTVKFSHKHNLPKYSPKINMDNKKNSSKCVK